jgi:alkanesulfonate monooxygenase SsuD/methylene tetrahydromethanopterin reductase-like flavin-dependent oxidoreductase (luciferase family)
MHFARGVTASPLLALSAFAARTQRIRLATTSLLLPIHEPRALADEIAAVDRASRGRLLIGLGRGFRAPLFRAFGVDPKVKRDRFDAALEAMRRGWSQQADAVRSPWQRPHPPLAVAAFGPKGLAQAARHGLPYLPSPLESVARLEDNLRRHRDALPAGVDPDDLVVPVMRTVHVAADDAEAKHVLSALDAEARAMVGRAPRSLVEAAGDDVEERVVVGTAPRVRDRLGELRERLGIDLLIVRSQVPALDPSAREAGVQRLVEEVWPALR